MERTTKKQVEKVFELFCNEHGYRIAKSHDDHGAYRLDYAGCYGGYTIERIDDDSTGISHPFGMNRRSARVMYDMLLFSMYVSQHNRKGA